jgi:hypothetical protein
MTQTSSGFTIIPKKRRKEISKKTCLFLFLILFLEWKLWYKYSSEFAQKFNERSYEIMKNFFRRNRTKIVKRKIRKISAVVGLGLVASQIAPCLTPYAAPELLSNCQFVHLTGTITLPDSGYFYYTLYDKTGRLESTDRKSGRPGTRQTIHLSAGQTAYVTWEYGNPPGRPEDPERRMWLEKNADHIVTIQSFVEQLGDDPSNSKEKQQSASDHTSLKSVDNCIN